MVAIEINANSTNSANSVLEKESNWKTMLTSALKY